MRGRWILLSIVVAALGCSDDGGDATEDSSSVESLPPGLFLEVAAKSGVDFRLENGISEAKILIETMAGGVGWVDVDGDGHFDLYLPNGHDSSKNGWKEGAQSNRLYRNRGDGTFEDITEHAGVGDKRFSNGLAIADYDNDGDSDILVTNVGRNTLYRNRGDGTFDDVTESAGVTSQGIHSSAVWFDFDLDGDLDLFITRYLEFRPDLARRCRERGVSVYCHPRFFDGASDVLYENVGGGRFEDISEAAGIAKGGPNAGKGLGVISGDFNGDGRFDLYVANDTTANFFWANLGGGKFKDRAFEAGIALSHAGKAQAGMGVDWGDIDGDGDLDIHVTNFSNETNNLFLHGEGGQFTEGIQKAKLGASFRRLGFGTLFGDYDIDGDLDLVIANGHVDDTVDDNAEKTGVSYRQAPDLFLNEGAGTFTHGNDRAGAAFAEKYVGRGLASCDFDNDGDLDLAMACIGGPVVLLLNTTRDRADSPHFLRVRLRGTKSSRDSYGARVVATIGTTTRVFDCQSGRSYLSACDPRILIGLGNATRIDKLQVTWPSGASKVLENVEGDREIEIVEP